MQGSVINGKKLYRYAVSVVDTDNGSTIEQFTKKKAYWMNINPAQVSRSKTENGFADSRSILITIANCHDFQLSDRIGTEDTILYEVTAVYDYPTVQELDVIECPTQ